MPSDEPLEVPSFVYRYDFVRMVQLRLDTGAIRKIRRLEVVDR